MGQTHLAYSLHKPIEGWVHWQLSPPLDLDYGELRTKASSVALYSRKFWCICPTLKAEFMQGFPVVRNFALSLVETGNTLLIGWSPVATSGMKRGVHPYTRTSL